MTIPESNQTDVVRLKHDVVRLSSLLADARKRNADLRLAEGADELQRLLDFALKSLGAVSAESLRAELAQAYSLPTEAELAGLLTEMLANHGEVSRLHKEYMGKAMPDAVYDRFVQLRDEDVPRVRQRFLSVFLQEGMPQVSRQSAELRLSGLLAERGFMEALPPGGAARAQIERDLDLRTKAMLTDAYAALKMQLSSKGDQL